MTVVNKKPKTYSIEEDEILCGIIKIFYYFGMWHSDTVSSFCKTGKRFCYVIFFALFIVFLGTNAFLCDDKSESIFSVQCAVVASVVFVKLLYILYKKQEIFEFLYDPNVAHSKQDHQDSEKINKKIVKFSKFVRAYGSIIAVTYVLVIVIRLPLLSGEKGLPLFISFSWQDSEVIYWLAFVFVSWGSFCCLISNLIAVLIWYIMLNFSIEYQMLGKKLRNLGTGSTRNRIEIMANKKNSKLPRKNSKLPQQNLFLENLIVLIKAHRNLTETIQRFKSCFSTLFLAQITTSGIVICISVYNLAYQSMENIFQTEMFIAILLYGIFDIFSVMYLANEITYESDRLSLFESSWFEQTQSCKKYVLIMGEILKQPLEFVILIYPMNLETFTSIVNSGYSMFNILKNFK